jgi:hypothetical protein
VVVGGFFVAFRLRSRQIKDEFNPQKRLGKTTHAVFQLKGQCPNSQEIMLRIVGFEEKAS